MLSQTLGSGQIPVSYPLGSDSIIQKLRSGPKEDLSLKPLEYCYEAMQSGLLSSTEILLQTYYSLLGRWFRPDGRSSPSPGNAGRDDVITMENRRGLMYYSLNMILILDAYYQY